MQLMSPTAKRIKLMEHDEKARREKKNTQAAKS